MSRPIVLERTTGIGIASAVLTAGLLAGAGAFLGGYALGERSAPEQTLQTELAEKTYTVDDLEAALVACEIEGVSVESSSVTLLGADYPGMNRQCFIAEMGATELADREFSFGLGTRPEDYLDGGEYSWSNVHMVWEQASDGRDVTITVE